MVFSNGQSSKDPNISQRELLTRLNKDPNIEITCSQIGDLIWIEFERHLIR
jgi:hypothetical protein